MAHHENPVWLSQKPTWKLNYFWLIILSIRLAGETSRQEGMVPAGKSQPDANGLLGKYWESLVDLDECIYPTSSWLLECTCPTAPTTKLPPKFPVCCGFSLCYCFTPCCGVSSGYGVILCNVCLVVLACVILLACVMVVACVVLLACVIVLAIVMV